MGVADRDWSGPSHRQGRRAARAPRRPWHPLLVIPVVICLFVVGSKVDRWIGERRTAELEKRALQDHLRRNPRVVLQPEARERPAALPIQVEYPPIHLAPPTTRTVARCTVNGRVTYSDACAGGGPTHVLQVDASGGESSQGLTAYQRELLRSADARIAREAAAAQADMLARQQRATSNRGECAALDEQIRALDAWARQPLSGYQQDDIRGRRQAHRSRQYALRC